MDRINTAIFSLTPNNVVTNEGKVVHKNLLDNRKKMSVETLVATFKQASVTQFGSNKQIISATTAVGTLLNRLIVKRDSLKNHNCIIVFFNSRKIANYNKLIKDLTNTYTSISNQTIEDPIPTHTKRHLDQSIEKFETMTGTSTKARPKAPPLPQVGSQSAPIINVHFITEEEARTLVNEMFGVQMDAKMQNRFAKHLLKNNFWISKTGELSNDSEKKVFNQLLFQFLETEFPRKGSALGRLKILQERQAVIIDPMLLLHRCTETLVTRMDDIHSKIVLKSLGLPINEVNIAKLMDSDFWVPNSSRLSPLEKAEVQYILEERESPSPSSMLSTPISIASSESITPIISPINMIGRLIRRGRKSPVEDTMASPAEVTKPPSKIKDRAKATLEKGKEKMTKWFKSRFGKQDVGVFCLN